MRRLDDSTLTLSLSHSLFRTHELPGVNQRLTERHSTWRYASRYVTAGQWRPSQALILCYTGGRHSGASSAAGERRDAADGVFIFFFLHVLCKVFQQVLAKASLSFFKVTVKTRQIQQSPAGFKVDSLGVYSRLLHEQHAPCSEHGFAVNSDAVTQ